MCMHFPILEQTICARRIPSLDLIIFWETKCCPNSSHLHFAGGCVTIRSMCVFFCVFFCVFPSSYVLLYLGQNTWNHNSSCCFCLIILSFCTCGLFVIWRLACGILMLLWIIHWRSYLKCQNSESIQLPGVQVIIEAGQFSFMHLFLLLLWTF